MISPDRRRAAVEQVMAVLRVSERRACRVIGQPRATQRYPKKLDEGEEVLQVLLDLFLQRGVPVHIRSDNGSEFIAKRVRSFLSRLEVKPLFIEPGSPWENGYIESINGKMRDELLSREIFYSLKEAQVLVEMWRKHYNTVRPLSSLGYRPPASETIVGQPSQIQQFNLTL